MSDRIRRLLICVLLSGLLVPSWAQQLLLPIKPDSLRFAVIGDSGTGDKFQYELADRLAAYRSKFPYEFVLMMGDNIYGKQTPADFAKKFEQPYKTLIDGGIKFYATLGNHDNPGNDEHYKLFNMSGQRYYTFKPKAGVRFFALDSNYMDKKQLEWLEDELRNSGSEWKICYFHHPLYSSGGRHGADEALKAILEPRFVKYGVNAVFSGHDHVYERIKPQNGIYYFVSGAAGKLARGDIKRSNLTAKGFDQDRHFMIVEIAGGELYFQVISRAGQTVDSGVLQRPKANPGAGQITMN